VKWWRVSTVPLPILSDAGDCFGAALTLPHFTTGRGIYLKRLTLILKDGLIEAVFYPVRRRPMRAICVDCLGGMLPKPRSDAR
jgi:hypothetical protein